MSEIVETSELCPKFHSLFIFLSLVLTLMPFQTGYAASFRFSLDFSHFSSRKLSCFLTFLSCCGGGKFETQCVRVCLPVKSHCFVCMSFVSASLCELQGAILRGVTYILRFLSIPACFMQVCSSPSAHTGVKKAQHKPFH